MVGNFVTMRDTEHMTPDYARWLATPLAAALDLDGDARPQPSPSAPEGTAAG